MIAIYEGEKFVGLWSNSSDDVFLEKTIEANDLNAELVEAYDFSESSSIINRFNNNEGKRIGLSKGKIGLLNVKQEAKFEEKMIDYDAKNAHEFYPPEAAKRLAANAKAAREHMKKGKKPETFIGPYPDEPEIEPIFGRQLIEDEILELEKEVNGKKIKVLEKLKFEREFYEKRKK